jgi:hypothetical protein
VENNTRAPTPGKRGTPRARPEPDSLGEGEQADTKPRGVLETSSLKQLSNPVNCCLRLRFIGLALSLYIGVGYEGAWLV